MKLWEGRIFAVFHKAETQGEDRKIASHYAQCPPSASLMEAYCYVNRWNSIPVSDLEGRSGEADIPNFFWFTLPKGSTCMENICIPTPPPLLLLARGIHFSGLWVWRKKGLFPLGLLFGIHAVCLKWVFLPVSPLREWLAATSLRAVRCQQKAPPVDTYKPNSPVSFISNQPDILIFRFSPYLSCYQTRRM